jgi:hypothetical protein
MWKSLYKTTKEEKLNTAITSDPVSVRSTVSQRERWKEYKSLFGRVAETYGKVRNLPPTVSSTIDDDPTSHSCKWTPQSCHFQIDVEHAIRDAIGDRADTEELYDAWERLVESMDIIGSLERTLIERAGKLFKIRGLEPRDYFRPAHISANSRRRAA